MVRDLDMTRHALRTESRETERMRSCLSVVEMALIVADREMVAVEAALG